MRLRRVTLDDIPRDSRGFLSGSPIYRVFLRDERGRLVPKDDEVMRTWAVFGLMIDRKVRRD